MLFGVIINRKQERWDVLVVELSVGGWIDGKTSLVRNAATDDRLLCAVLSDDSDSIEKHLETSF